MQTSTIIAALVAPTLGAGMWWLFQYPGRKIHDYLWVHMPEGPLREILLKKR